MRQVNIYGGQMGISMGGVFKYFDMMSIDGTILDKDNKQHYLRLVTMKSPFAIFIYEKS